MSETKETIDYDKFVEMSTDMAEEEHHKHCEFECCGEHDDFVDYDKCPKCGMTPEIQEDHNNEWWSAVDEIESDLRQKYNVENDPYND